MEIRKNLLASLGLKHASIEEFNFDSIWAPGIYQLMSPTDVYDLHELATSVKYNSKIKFKYSSMDYVMKRAGFRQFHAGTNRRIYYHLDFKQLMAKVAIDDAGLKDSPGEYKNQMLLAPFCTKIFDVSQCGTVGFVERWEPFLNKEMFEEHIEEIFNVLYYLINKRYAVADIGSKYFMNWGIRPGFGPGLLDFPYVYQLDNANMYCKNILDNNMPCTGRIRADAGFNEYVCDKCGKVYQARDLELAIENNEISLIGGITMNLKMKISLGDKVVFDNRNDIEETVALEPTKVAPKKVGKYETPRIIVERNGERFIDGRRDENYHKVKEAFKNAVREENLNKENKVTEEVNPVATAVKQVVKELKEEEKKNEPVATATVDKDKVIERFKLELQQYKEDNEALEERCNALEKQIEDNNSVYERMKGDIHSARETLSSLREVLKARNDYAGKLERESLSKDKEIEALKSTLEGSYKSKFNDEYINYSPIRVSKSVCTHCGLIIKGHHLDDNCYRCGKRLFSIHKESDLVNKFMNGDIESFEVDVADAYPDTTEAGINYLMDELQSTQGFDRHRALFSNRVVEVEDHTKKELDDNEVAEIVDHRLDDYNDNQDKVEYSKLTTEEIGNISGKVNEDIPADPEPADTEDVIEEKTVEKKEEKLQEVPKTIDLSTKKNDKPKPIGNVVRSNLQEDPIASGERNIYGNKRKKGKGKNKKGRKNYSQY